MWSSHFLQQSAHRHTNLLPMPTAMAMVVVVMVVTVAVVMVVVVVVMVVVVVAVVVVAVVVVMVVAVVVVAVVVVAVVVDQRHTCQISHDVFCCLYMCLLTVWYGMVCSYISSQTHLEEI